MYNAYVVLRQVGHTAVLTVPKEAVEALGWKKGDRLKIQAGDSAFTAKREAKSAVTAAKAATNNSNAAKGTGKVRTGRKKDVVTIKPETLKLLGMNAAGDTKVRKGLPKNYKAIRAAEKKEAKEKRAKAREEKKAAREKARAAKAAKSSKKPAKPAKPAKQPKPKAPKKAKAPKAPKTAKKARVKGERKSKKARSAEASAAPPVEQEQQEQQEQLPADPELQVADDAEGAEEEPWFADTDNSEPLPDEDTDNADRDLSD